MLYTLRMVADYIHIYIKKIGDNNHIIVIVQVKKRPPPIVLCSTKINCTIDMQEILNIYYYDIILSIRILLRITLIHTRGIF